VGLLSHASVAVACLTAGCGFSPALSDRFACGGAGECPEGLICASDRVCRLIDEAPVELGSPFDAGTSLDRDAATALDLARAAVAPDLAMPPDPSTSTDLAPVDSSTCIPLPCGGATCGELLDGCGGRVSCGGCDKDRSCGAAGANRCGKGDCEARDCEALGKSCGLVSDGCERLIDCGSCAGSLRCGGGGIANVCG